MQTLPIDLSNIEGKLYLCEWNGGEILEIHTPSSFFDQYKDTNLYDDGAEIFTSKGYYPMDDCFIVCEDFKQYLYDDNFKMWRIK